MVIKCLGKCLLVGGGGGGEGGQIHLFKSLLKLLMFDPSVEGMLLHLCMSAG